MKLEDMSVQELNNTYKKVFSSIEGKLVLEDLGNRFNPQVPAVFEDAIIDPYRLAMNEGKRSVIFHIKARMEEDVEARPDNP